MDKEAMVKKMQELMLQRDRLMQQAKQTEATALRCDGAVMLLRDEINELNKPKEEPKKKDEKK